MLLKDSEAINASRGFGPAWLIAAGALAVHVLEEALGDFLGFYHPAVHALRERVPFLPVPTFSFPAWITLLVGAFLLLVALSPLAFRSDPRLRPVALALATLWIFVGAGHFLGAAFGTALAGRPMPGVYTAPLLIASGGYLIHRLRRRRADG